jgi:hypothetical protein
MGPIVVPADEPAEHSPDDRSDVPVAPLVLGQYGGCLGGIQVAVPGSESVIADCHLGDVVCDQVAVPLRRASKAGEDHDFVTCGVLADDFEHRLILAPASAAGMGETQESSTEDPAEMPVVEACRRAENAR